MAGVNLGDGVTTSFVAELIDVSGADSTVDNEAVEVYIGGIRQYGGYTITDENPVTVEFDTAPTTGYEVAILVRRAHTWYNVNTPNLPLNETDTICARFLQGQ